MAYMNRILFVPLVLGCISFVVGSRPYELKIDRVEEHPEVTDRHYDFSKLTAKKFNRTTIAVNGTVYILKPVPHDTIVHVTINEWLVNDFKPTITLPPQNMCLFFETDLFTVREIATHTAGTWNGKCPLNMKEIHVINLLIDEDKLPPQFPGEKWRVDAKGMSKGVNIGGFRGYITVDRVKGLREKDGPMG